MTRTLQEVIATLPLDQQQEIAERVKRLIEENATLRGVLNASDLSPKIAQETFSVGIASLPEMRDHTIAVARGELKPKPDDPKMWFVSPEGISNALSNKNESVFDNIAAQIVEKLRPDQK